jgi:hypothetical protein
MVVVFAININAQMVRTSQRNVVHLIKQFSGRVWRRLDFPSTHRIECGD